MVVVGADAVTENGGVVSQVRSQYSVYCTLLYLQIGTYQIALLAHALSKPLYVAAESFKFTRVFPLNQRDLPGTVFMLSNYR